MFSDVAAQKNKNVLWAIAGSDSGSGAGVQADLLTGHDLGVHVCTVVTAATAQNSVGVAALNPLPVAAVHSQIGALAADLPARVIKLGMLANADIVAAVAEYLSRFDGLVVCDPVLSASTGGELLDGAGLALFREVLLPRVDVLTPNRMEAELLSGVAITSAETTEQAAAALLATGSKAVLITGGHADWLPGSCCDYFSNGDLAFWMSSPRLDTPHSHGSGCTIATALASGLARGMDIEDAVVVAKAYVTQGIRAGYSLGRGSGPVAHRGWPRQLVDFPKVFKQAPSMDSELQGDFPGEVKHLGLYPVVDSIEWLQRLLSLGVKTLQLRIKNQSPVAVDAQVAEAVALGRQYQARLYINDYWQLAIKHGAYGVHLGQEDLDVADIPAIAAAGLRLGVSTHCYYEICRAHALAPSYIAMGPIFPTQLKKMRWYQQGIPQLQEWVDLLGKHYSLVAIGGIDYDKAQQVLATGVGSVALVSAITQAPDYAAATRRLQELFAGA